MGIVQVHPPNHIQSIIDRQVAEGRAASEADYIVEALRLYADHLEAEDEIAGMAERADADMAAARYVTVATSEDSEALHQAAMVRLRARLAAERRGTDFLAALRTISTASCSTALVNGALKQLPGTTD